MTQASVTEEQVWEREYREHQVMARAMLRRSFPSIRDPEEIYQEAWAEVLEMRARGEQLINLGGLLRTIVWRRACDRTRRRGADPVDPDSGVFGYQVDAELPPDEQVQLRIDGALARQVVESLDERQAAAIRLRFDEQLDSNEIQQRLGVTRKRLDKIFTSTYRQVEHALTDLDGTSEWRRRQRSLLYACETGIASERQRRKARRMVEEDPRCRAMLSEIRSTLKGIAAVIPLPVLVSATSDGRAARVRFALVERAGGLRDQLADWAGRLFSHGSAAEQAGAGGAVTAAGGAAVKAALVCAAVTGGAVVCVTGGVLSSTPSHHHRAPVARHEAAVRPPEHAPVMPAITHVTVHRHHKSAVSTSASPSAVRAVTAAPPPSPAPSGSTEFGPGSVGSSGASATPAAAPSGGGVEFTP